jgi:RimJ/RimL family protein N-acetyltransferase
MVTRRAKMERMAPIAPPTLSDGAVTLRPPADADGPALVHACQDPEIPRWTRVPRPYTPEDARQFVAIAATEAAAGLGVALVIADEREALIGTIGLMELDAASGRAEIGYWLAREARGRGAATRAVRLLCAWAARELGVRRVEILTHGDNAPSARVAERAGFTPTGETRRVARMPPGRRDGYMVHVWRAPEP